MSERSTLKSQFLGSDLDQQHVRLADLAGELTAIDEALLRVDQYVNRTRERSVQYRVVALSHNSPASVTIEAFPVDPQGDDNSESVVASFVRIWQELKDRADLDQYPTSVLEAFRKIASPLSRRIREVSFSYLGRGATVGVQEIKTIEAALERHEKSIGSAVGMLEAINVHNNANTFRIFPFVGAQSITCRFEQKLRAKALAAAGSYVEVRGLMLYRLCDPFPHEIKVDEIEILPDDDELPRLTDLHGVAPDATGGEEAEQFVNRMREDEW